MTKRVLVFGQRHDPHIRSVTSILGRSASEVLLFDPNEPQASRLTCTANSDGCGGFISLDGEVRSFDEIGSVWWRVKPLTVIQYGARSSSIGGDFAQREWRSVLDSMESFLGHALWVNPRLGDLRAKNKPMQLTLARRLGLQIPPTLISNDPAAIVDFIHTRGRECVYKALTWYFAPPDRMVFTSSVNAEQVRSDPEAVATAPGIFQVRIPKSYEIRATVVGERIFTARIDSQVSEDTKLDWRRNQAALPLSRYDLPGDIREALLKMNERLGIVFGAYDVIVTPSGEYVFLEVNSLGQWLWLEKATGLPISEALAELLLGRPSKGHNLAE